METKTGVGKNQQVTTKWVPPKSKQVGPFKKSSKGKPSSAERDRMKIYFKHDGCSMLLFHGLSATNASLRVNELKRIFNDWCGHFIITK